MPYESERIDSTLNDYVSAELARMHQRLEREGLEDLTELPYASYIRSALWAKIKRWVLARDQAKCRICDRQKLSTRIDDMDVHHRSYTLAVLEGRCAEMLVSLCPSCHKRVEGERETRRTLVEKDEQLLRLQRLHRRIEKEHLQVHISRDNPRSLALNLHYVGDTAFLEFYEIISLLRTFVIHVTMLAETKHLVRLPLPQGDQHLRQTSGTRILDASTNRTWLTVRVLSSQRGSIHVAKTCPLPVLDLISESAQRAEKWRVASLPMQEKNAGAAL